MPLSCTQTAGYLPFCDATSCCKAAHGGLLQIVLIFFCFHHFAIAVAVALHGDSSQPLLCKPVPVPRIPVLEFCRCHFALCCLKSILTAVAVDAHCIHCFWHPCRCCLLTPLVDCFHLIFFSSGHARKCGRCRMYCAMTAMCLACAPFPATSTTI